MTNDEVPASLDAGQKRPDYAGEVSEGRHVRPSCCTHRDVLAAHAQAVAAAGGDGGCGGHLPGHDGGAGAPATLLCPHGRGRTLSCTCTHAVSPKEVRLESASAQRTVLPWKLPMKPHPRPSRASPVAKALNSALMGVLRPPSLSTKILRKLVWHGSSTGCGGAMSRCREAVREAHLRQCCPQRPRCHRCS